MMATQSSPQYDLGKISTTRRNWQSIVWPYAAAALTGLIFIHDSTQAIYAAMPLMLLAMLWIQHLPFSVIMRGAISLPVQDVLANTSAIVFLSWNGKLASRGCADRNRGRVWLRHVITVALLIVPAFAQQCTQTQCVLTYTAPDAGACYLTGTDNSGFVPSINDLNPTLFAGANIDLERTVANGFKWPTIVSGNQRTVFIGSGPGGSSKKALDNNWYTVPLQVATPHTFTVSCAGGSVVGTIDTTTANIPLGNYYPEPPPTDPSAPFGQVALPTFRWDRKTPYIADNGVLIRQISMPTDFPEYPNRTPFAYVLDRNGTWTTPQNAKNDYLSNTAIATSSAINNPLFLGWSAGTPEPNVTNWNASVGKYPTDLQITLYGNGGAELALCISLDSGQTCASAPVSFSSFSGSSTTYTFPAGFPSSHFKAWGVNPKTLGGYDVVNMAVGSVSTLANHVIFPSTTVSAGTPAVNLNRAAGSKFQVAGCSTAGTYTVASVDSHSQITSVETIGTAGGCTYFDLGAGLRIVQTSAGTVNLSVTYKFALAFPPLAYQNPNYNACSLIKVTDIATDCDGVAQSPNLSGYLCQFGNINGTHGGLYLMQDNGRVCLQSTMYAPSTDYLTMFPGGAWDPSNGKKIAGHIGNTLYTMEKTSTNYTEHVPGTTVPPASDGWTYTPYTPSPVLFDQNPANPSQLKSLCGPGGTNAANCSEVWRHFTAGYPSVVWQMPNIAAAIAGYTVWNTAPLITGGESIFMKFRTDYAGNLVQAFTTFDKVGYRWNRQHSAPQGIGPFVAQTSSTQVAFQSGLNGPHALKFTSIYKGSTGTFTATTIPVDSCTAANPIVCTVSAEHRLDQYIVAGNGSGTATAPPRAVGSLVTITGGTSGWAALNGEWLAVAEGNKKDTILNTAGAKTKFTLYGTTNATAVNSSSFGSWPGSITFTTTPPVHNYSVFGMDGSNPAVITLNQVTEGIEPYTPDHGWQTGDLIGVAAYPTTQFYAERINGTQIKLYTNIGRTVGVTAVSHPLMSGSGIYDAKTCPTSLPAILFDSQGTDNQVRCVDVQIAGEPCSYLATANEAAAYPCALDSSNTGKAQLQTIAVGDAIGDVGRGQFTENMRIGAKSGTTLTLVRFTGGDITPGMPSVKPQQGNHETGWMPYMIGTYNLIDNNPTTAFIDATDATATPKVVTPVLTDHTDLIYCGSGGLLSYTGSNGYVGAQEDPITCLSFASFIGRVASRLHQYPRFMAYKGFQTIGYVGGRHPADPSNWATDWFNNIGGQGGDGNGQGSSYIRRDFTLAPSTSRVYKVARGGGEVFSPKIVPDYLTAAPTIFIDKSGPGSLITDSDLGKRCTAYAAGECRPGSSIGDMFMAAAVNYGSQLGTATSNNPAPFLVSNGTLTNMVITGGTTATFTTPNPHLLAPGTQVQVAGITSSGPVVDSNSHYTIQVPSATTFSIQIPTSTNGTYSDSTMQVATYSFDCSNNTLNLPTACAYQLAGANGMMIQQRIEPFDQAGQYYRGVTRGFMPPSFPYSFQHMTTTPDGKWGAFVATILNGSGQNLLIAKLPPFPPPDGIDRSRYINVEVKVGPGRTGDQVRVQFGYAENADPMLGYCTTRAEACYTSAGATDSNPFQFASETQSRTACATGCTISIPAISRRVLYYRVLRYNGGGEVAGPLQWKVVP